MIGARVHAFAGAFLLAFPRPTAEQMQPYVGAWKHHIGLYPIPALPPDLEANVAPYRTKIDTVRFSYKQPIPYDVIERLIDALIPIRIKENDSPSSRRIAPIATSSDRDSPTRNVPSC